MMEIKTITTALVIICIAIGALSVLDAQEQRTFHEVKEGKRVLSCWIGRTFKDIDPARVVALRDDRWEFDNGTAKRCQVSELLNKEQ